MYFGKSPPFTYPAEALRTRHATRIAPPLHC
jgi:hypothetical protein